ncbi:MAG: AIPR family protein, partial [Euryarchaeota archaeon]|nr:AIPR family protein [Euryarchaeota archaeon]
EEANKHVLDDTNDCGVDVIWVDKNNHQILVCQIEYDTKVWSKNPADQKKATETFNEFLNYLESSNLPERLHDAAKPLWRQAKKLNANDKYSIRYLYITPKHFNDSQIEKIRKGSGISGLEFFTNETLIERGEEFLDGQTGMCSFKINFKNKSLHIPYDFGSIYVINVNLIEIHKIVDFHEKNKKLKALFASNVRSYLTTKRRSKEIASAMIETIKNQPDHFLICNNGITIQCNKVTPENDSLFLERASISNGCQTVMNVNRFFNENEGANPNADVLVTVIELTKNAPLIAGEIARSRNSQNPVDNRDLRSNNHLLVTLHHRLSADRLYGSEKRYYLLRKQGEKQTLLREEPDAKGKFMWIDAEYLAQCIAAVIRQNPVICTHGTNDLFGNHFNEIFPEVQDPTHSRCKYAFWLAQMVWQSYESKSKWKGIKDKLINQQKDFKSPARWIISALIANELIEHFSCSESLEKRFVEKCEKWWYNNSSDELNEFKDKTFLMIDDYFRLLYAISKTLLGEKLPKARDIYTNYEDLFKGPSYDSILLRIRKGNMITYQDRARKSANNFIDYLKNN